MATNPGTPATLMNRLEKDTGPRCRVQSGLHGTRSQIDGSSSLEWHSFRKPTLQGGTYSISISQRVEIPDGSHVDLVNEHEKSKSLIVEAARFQLQSSDILSIYPPPLSTADLTVLPNVIFTAPALPWERVAEHDATEPGPDQGLVPWLALIVFEKDELIQKPASLSDISNDPDTCSFKVKLGDLLNCPDISLPILKSHEKITADESAVNLVDVIFLSPSTFIPLVYDTYSDDGSLKLPNPAASIASDISRYQYLAHTRKASADSDGIDAEEHSVIFSHRTPKASSKAARAVVVHLVTIEGWDSLKLGIDCSKPAVALISLHSWTYTVNPAAPPRFLDMLAPLAESPSTENILKIPNGLQLSDDRMLRYPSATTAKLDKTTGLNSEKSTALKMQMACGYSIHKYRLPTGEPTIALYRGPLTPVAIPDNIFLVPGKKGIESSFGKDLDIMNEKLGMNDIAYSSAWSSGWLLAASNKDFCDALTRLRRRTLNKSLKDATLESRRTFAADSAQPIVTAIPRLWPALSTLVGSDNFASIPSTEGKPSDERWRVTDRKPGLMVHSRPGISSNEDIDKLASSIKMHVHKLTSIPQDSSNVNAVLEPYNELNKSNSSTYPTVLRQVLDFKFLDTIPINYLIPCSDFLTPDSLRFFYIDRNWIDAFVDGALSIGNTLDIDGTDPIKAGIKDSVARYENTPIDYPLGRHKPQMPRYGFLIRSNVIKTWPDVRFAAPFPEHFKGGKLEILGTRRLASDIMMVLLDRCPEDIATEDDIPPDAIDDIKRLLRKSIADAKAFGGIPLLTSISVVQPPHHQNLVLGSFLDDQIIKTNFVDFDMKTTNWQRLNEVQFQAKEPDKSIYDWENHLIKVRKLQALLRATLPSMKDQTGFKDVGPILLGLNLSSTIDALRMNNDGTTNDSRNSDRPLPQSKTSTRMTSQRFAVPGSNQEMANVVATAPNGGVVIANPMLLAKHQSMADAELIFGTIHLRDAEPIMAHLAFDRSTAPDVTAVRPLVLTEAVRLSFSTLQIPLEGINRIPITSGLVRLARSPDFVDLLITLSVTDDSGVFFETRESVNCLTICLPLSDHASTPPQNTGPGFLKSYAANRPRIWYKQQFGIDMNLEAPSDLVPYPHLAIVISSRWSVGSFTLKDLDGTLVGLAQVTTEASHSQDISVMTLIRFTDGTLKKAQTTVQLLASPTA